MSVGNKKKNTAGYKELSKYQLNSTTLVSFKTKRTLNNSGLPINILAGGGDWRVIRDKIIRALSKGVLSSHKSVTGILPNNPTMLPPFSIFINFHPKLSDSCSGLIIRLEW